jgi:hypothetical protein
MSLRAVEPAGLVLQTDPEELPPPGRQVEGCNIAGHAVRRSWSRALVRHRADAWEVLLGVPAEDIPVRDCPE